MVNKDVRSDIVLAAKWGFVNRQHFIYTEAANRMAFEKQGIKFPITTDCSGFVTFCYFVAGAADPNGANYAGWGYTGTLLQHGKQIALKDVQPGDVVVYGPGTGWHTAVVVDVSGPNATNPLTISHGQQGDPSFVHVLQDNRQPIRYLRFPTAQVRPSVPLA